MAQKSISPLFDLVDYEYLTALRMTAAVADTRREAAIAAIRAALIDVIETLTDDELIGVAWCGDPLHVPAMEEPPEVLEDWGVIPMEDWPDEDWPEEPGDWQGTRSEWERQLVAQHNARREAFALAHRQGQCLERCPFDHQHGY